MLKTAESLDGQTCAEYSVIAEPNRARERAEAEARRTVDLLRLLIPEAQQSGERISIGLQGEVPGPRSFLSIVSRYATGTVLHQPSRVPLTALRLDDVRLARLRDSGLLVMSDLLQKRDREITLLETLLIRSMHWLGNGITQVDPPNALLNLMTAAEVLVGGDPIAETLAVRTALLLETKTDEQEKLCERIVQLHHLRSVVSHSGGLEATASDVEELMRRSLTLFHFVLERRGSFPTKRSLGNYCESLPNEPRLRELARTLSERLRDGR